MATREHWEMDLNDLREVRIRVIGIPEEDDTRTQRAVHKILEDVEDGDPRRSCLEIGAGYGRLLPHMANHFEFAEGVDSSSNLVKLAVDNLQGERRCRVVLTNGECLPYFDNTFYLVYAFTVFQHMVDISTIRNNIREAHRVLVPNGICRVQTVCEDPEIYHDGHVFGSLPEFEQEFIDAGFKSVEGSFDEEIGNWIWVTARKG